jgi:hypothetical protein
MVIENKSPKELAAMGYRRTSNKYGMLSRIDRADWIEVLAAHLRRAPADFYIPGEKFPAANWCDFYRRVLSKDTIEIDPNKAREVPSSSYDPIGFVEI